MGGAPLIVEPCAPSENQFDNHTAEESASLGWSSKESAPLSTEGRRRQGGRPKAKITRKRLTVYLPVALLDRLRNAVYWTQGLTLAGLIERAVMETLDNMESQRGMPFSQRLEELKGGRPKRKRSAESGQPRSAA